MDLQLDGRRDDAESQSDIGRLISAAQMGDWQALEMLLARVYPTVLRFLVHLSRDAELARDLTQETLWTVFRELNRLNRVDAFMPWLYRIARNTFYSAHRKHKLRPTVSLDWLLVQRGNDTAFPDPIAPIERWDDCEAIHQVLAELTPAAREVIYLRHIVGYSGPEIAAILGISRSAAKQRICRAERDFRYHHKEFQSATNLPAREVGV